MPSIECKLSYNLWWEQSRRLWGGDIVLDNIWLLKLEGESKETVQKALDTKLEEAMNDLKAKGWLLKSSKTNSSGQNWRSGGSRTVYIFAQKPPVVRRPKKQEK